MDAGERERWRGWGRARGIAHERARTPDRRELEPILDLLKETHDELSSMDELDDQWGVGSYEPHPLITRIAVLLEAHNRLPADPQHPDPIENYDADADHRPYTELTPAQRIARKCASYKRQLDAVDRELRWEGTGNGRVESIRLLARGNQVLQHPDPLTEERR